MEENKDTTGKSPALPPPWTPPIKPEVKKSVIPSILFIIYHLGLIGCIIGIIVEAVTGREYHLDGVVFHTGLMITFAIGMHFFGNLLYKEYGHDSFFRRNL